VLLPLARPAGAAGDAGVFYRQTTLVANLPGVAPTTDAHLRNAWGLVASPTSPWWVADNGTGVATLYDGAGQPAPAGAPLVVTIPPLAGSPAGTTAAPTGLVFNGTAAFVVTAGGLSGASRFIFATEDGTIAGWSPVVDRTQAILAVDHAPAGAVYKGLALASTAAGPCLYATNFHAGTIDVFNTQFQQITPAGSFADPQLPTGYAPFGISASAGQLYVTYALQDAARHDDVAGPGHGFIDVFDADGHLLRRVATRGPLNSPWGLALAPGDFGAFSGALLVGNFGNGRINAYDPQSGAVLGPLHNEQGGPLTIDGLWSLAFGNGASAGPRTTLFFTAGPNDEADGRFGAIVPRGAASGR
jgi:uncharacterized protein (TIGR03118 family)